MNYENCFKSVKESLESIKGMPVTVRAIKGRKRFVLKDCIIDNVYNNIFTVLYTNRLGCEENICFSYADILTGTIKITVLNTQNKNIS